MMTNKQLLLMLRGLWLTQRRLDEKVDMRALARDIRGLRIVLESQTARRPKRSPRRDPGEDGTVH
jgi:hypothetical protein